MDESITHQLDQLDASELLALIGHATHALTDPRHRLATDADQLAVLHQALRVDAQLNAWLRQWAARLDTNQAVWREHGTSATSWLADVANLTRREATALINAGHEQARFPIIGDAALTGQILPTQAAAISSVLDDLPPEFPTDIVDRGQELMVVFARTPTSVELRRLTRHLLEVLAPETAEELQAARLDRELRQARRNRHLVFTPDHHGSILIKGSLPVIAAEPLIRIIDAYTAAEKRALDALDPEAEYLTPAMRRADGLLAMVNHHTQQALAPVNGGDRPRISILLSYDKLHKTAHDNGLLSATLAGTGEPVPAGELRRLLCDADLLPVVLGGPSEILDLGRAQRFVTPAQRTALEIRDRGCAVPGCDKPAQACHAHHITHWWAGGSSDLANLVLACPHHHGIVEPGHDPTADRWQIRGGPNHTPEVIPPRRVDARQRPRQHTRYLTRGLQPEKASDTTMPARR
ncbi:MAG: DUF222 domain-containing protein [Propionicimonas sp.]|nr:DUF222 domain-containing protein [Propionicimonas sp.]